MATTIDKLKDLDYDEIVALAVIEKDEDLNEIFTDEVKMSYNMLRTLSKEGKLSKDTQDFIRQLFDMVILTKSSLINKYILLAEADGKTIGEVQSAPIEEPKVEVEVVEQPKPKKEKKEKAIPRRYGKANILKDVASQGGKPTNAQLTALAVNDLKNIYVNLNARMVNDLLTDKPKLTDEDYRDIRATITIVKNKLKDILKKKG
jgi:hypothetical protein